MGLRTVLGSCRFCLSDNRLIPLSMAVDFEFTIQDVERNSGVQITEDEMLYCAICDNCCQIFEKSAALRITALSNTVVFKELFAVFIESLKADAIATEEVQTSQTKFNSQLNATASKVTNNEENNGKSNPIPSGEHPLSSSFESDGLCSNDEVLEDIDDMVEESKKPSPKEGDKKKLSCKPRELCSICGRLVSSYTQHSITHAKELNFVCTYCPKKFASNHYRKLHVESVHERKIIKSCEICGEGFMHRNSYSTHMITKHGIGKKYECKICDKTYYRSSHYTDHFNKAHGNQEYPCTICGRIFKSKNLLRGHQSVHSDDQPYACGQCPKRFKKRVARKNHELTHTGIRFECTLCEKSYRYKTMLSMHYRKDHEGTTPSKDNDACTDS